MLLVTSTSIVFLLFLFKWLLCIWPLTLRQTNPTRVNPHWAMPIMVPLNLFLPVVCLGVNMQKNFGQ